MGGTCDSMLKFQLRSGSAGLFKDKWDGGGGQVCAICNGGKVEYVKHAFCIGV